MQCHGWSGTLAPCDPVVVWPLIARVSTHVVGEKGLNKETEQLNVPSELRRPRARLWWDVSSTYALESRNYRLQLVAEATRTVAGGEEQGQSLVLLVC